jgi:hypothetical protein
LQLLVREGFSNAQLAIGWTDAVGGLPVAPQRCLRVEIGEIGECASSEKTLAHVSNGTLNAAILIAACRCDGTRFIAVMPSELEQGGMKANRVALPLQDGTFEILCGALRYVK